MPQNSQRRLRRLTVTVVLAFALCDVQAQRPLLGGLTDVPGIRVGHFALSERPTGCTVVLAEAGAVAGVDVRGGAPGTRETSLLAPENTIDRVHAVVLAGGSAFGLDAAGGVMRYLDERNIGFKVEFWREQVGVINVPIVPAAILIDLGVGGSPKIRPGPDCGYAAARAASDGPVGEGSIGAGAGATIGKFAGPKRAMKGGVGTASARLADGTVVGALVVVNALGDVIDSTSGRTIAGVRTEDGRRLADVRTLIEAGERSQTSIGANTTLGVIATNATLTKAQATKIAQMAQDGFARAIVPSHTPADGDTVFVLSTGVQTNARPDVAHIGIAAAALTAKAIIRGVEQATGVSGYPAPKDLSR